VIVGFDHLALTSTDLGASRQALLEEGYGCLFLEPSLPNPAGKAGLLGQFRPEHGIGYFRPAAGGIAIETVQHGPTASGPHGPYAIEDNLVVLRTVAVADELAFWQQALRFRPGSDGLLSLTSPVPGWSVRLKLVEDAGVADCLLDSPGFTCAAFYSNNLAEDTAKARNAGARDVTCPFVLQVNGKTLHITMFRTPGGALCELIQPEA